MTRDEILNMPVGREMDALIAEKVMGWQWKGIENYQRLYHPDGVHYCGMRYGVGEVEYTNRLEEYSTSMGAAWEVVDQMIFQSNQGLYLQFKNHLAEFTNNQLYPSWVTAAYICRAALLAVQYA